MYQIQTLNSIDPIIFDHFTQDSYTVGDGVTNPQGILVRSADMNQMGLPPSLLGIARAGAGTNNIPSDRCAQAGIVVFNTPGGNANAVTELVMAGLLLGGRRLVEGINWAQSLKGKGAEVPKLVEKGKNDFVGPELKGRKLAVIGLGAIGAQVANAAHYGLNMTVYGYDPFISVKSAWMLSRQILRSISLDSLLEQCDYFSLHVPLMSETRGYFGEKQFAAMKDGAVILNFARGELVDDAALIKALDSGRVRRYITDFPNEDLLGRDNVVCIPHLGASTPDSETNCADMAASQLKDYIENGNIVNSVNYPDCFMPRSTPHRLCILHRNVANMLAQFTSMLGQSGTNIETMLNKSRGDYACTLLDLSDPVGQDTVLRMERIEGILRVRIF